MLTGLCKSYLKTRGRELPGNYNHVLLTELFHHQSKRWLDIARDHLQGVHDNILAFVKKAVHHLDIEDRVLSEIHERMEIELEKSKS